MRFVSCSSSLFGIWLPSKHGGTDLRWSFCYRTVFRQSGSLNTLDDGLILFHWIIIGSKSIIRRWDPLWWEFTEVTTATSATVPKNETLHLSVAYWSSMQIFVGYNDYRDPQKWFCIWKSGSAFCVHIGDFHATCTSDFDCVWGKVLFLAWPSQAYNHLRQEWKLLAAGILQDVVHMYAPFFSSESFWIFLASLFPNVALERGLR